MRKRDPNRARRDYTVLDAAIIQAVRDGIRGETRMTSPINSTRLIRLVEEQFGADADAERTIDSRLQALRTKGRLSYLRPWGWSVVGDA